jgi:Tfp pilus assembly protein PilO
MSNLTLSSSKSSPGQTLILVGILFILVSILVSYLYMLPNLQKNYAKKANDTATMDVLSSAVARLKNDQLKLASAQNALDNKGITGDFLNKVNPQTEELPSVYLEMENVIATSSKVSAFTYQVGAPISDPKLGVKIPLVFTIKGTYLNLKEVLTRLETLQRPVTISSISFATSATTKPEDAGLLTLTSSGFLRAHALSDAYSTTPSH